MPQIADVIPSMFTQSSSGTDRLPSRILDRIFQRLAGQFGAKLAQLYGGVPPETVHDEWAIGLAGFQATELDRGLRLCSERAFAPTLGEFKRACRPALDPEFAFVEAGFGLRDRDAGKVGDWSHPAVYRAACAMSAEVRSGDWSKARARWTSLLRRELEAGWGEVPPVPARINDDRRPTSGIPKQTRADIQRILGTSARQKNPAGPS